MLVFTTTLSLLLIGLSLVREAAAWDYGQSGADWGGACQAQTGQSPINIDQPFTYEGGWMLALIAASP